VDIGIAVIVFVWMFDWTLAMIIFVTMGSYIFFTIWITEWRTKFRREMNELDTVSRGRAVDSLLNFETVKYYGNEAWEVADYERSVIEYQKADWKSNASLNVLNTAQNVVITTGLFCGLWVAAKRVTVGTLLIGDFVAFVTYILQLYQPLNWFGTYYRAIQQNFIDMEKMLDLLESNESIKDSPDASELACHDGGNIKFGTLPVIKMTENVCFSYGQKGLALENVTFSVPAGKKVALVGSSGGGKSTILRVRTIN
jgi:ATP-binding cassette subfamily B (MDR/TAP) protein 6